MYPSGEWVGHWDQNGMGRQEMYDLSIEFNGDELIGSGWDCVGKFSLRGKVRDDASVEIIKRYENRHSVMYEGHHDGEGLIYGAWALFGDNGSFALRPKGGFRRSNQPIAELVP